MSNETKIADVGAVVGLPGTRVGTEEGIGVGCPGLIVGNRVGIDTGGIVGKRVGTALGLVGTVGRVGNTVGAGVGTLTGAAVGAVNGGGSWL